MRSPSGPTDREKDTLRRMAEAGQRPATMAKFEALVTSGERLADLAAGDAKVVGQLCGFAPEELILAAGAVPLRLDTGHPPDGPGLPVDVCCAVRSLAAAGSLPAVDLTVVPTACDAKGKLADLWAGQRELFVLELPPSKRGSRSLPFFLDQIDSLIERLRDLTGRRVSRRGLREAIELTNRRTTLVRAIDELRRWDQPPITAADYFLVMQASFSADLGWWNDQAELLLMDISRSVASAEASAPRARLLLTGAPVLWPDFSLLLAIQAAGAEVVADDLCTATGHLHHPVVIDEASLRGMIRAVAEQSLLPTTCPCLRQDDDRLDRLLGLIDEARVEGVVHHSLRGCQLVQMDAVGLAAALEQRGVPFLDVHTELGAEPGGSLQNRLEAFVELLNQRREPPGA